MHTQTIFTPRQPELLSNSFYNTIAMKFFCILTTTCKKLPNLLESSCKLSVYKLAGGKDKS